MNATGHPATPQASAHERPLGELFSELAHETGTLVRKEVELAKTEMTGKAKLAAKDAAIVAAGGAVGLAGALTLLAAVVLALGTLIPLWVSALLVGIAVTALGAITAARGLRAFKRIDPAPQQTIRTLQEDRQWAR
jgi:hypothetical protein